MVDFKFNIKYKFIYKTFTEKKKYISNDKFNYCFFLILVCDLTVFSAVIHIFCFSLNEILKNQIILSNMPI